MEELKDILNMPESRTAGGPDTNMACAGYVSFNITQILNQNCFKRQVSVTKSRIILNGSTDALSEEVRLQLLAANDKLAVTLVPVMLFLGLLCVCGVAGNVLVLLLFSRKRRSSFQNLAILCLAFFDLLSCVLAIPYEIVDVRFYAFHVFDTDIICKVMKFINTFCVIGSIYTLLLIAIDRYKKVCQPLKKQIALRYYPYLLGFVVFVAALYSFPTFIVYGYRTIVVYGLTSRDCSTRDALFHTVYPTVYSGFLFMSFTVITVALTFMYSRVLQEVRRRNQRRRELKIKSSQIETCQSSFLASDEEITNVAVCDTSGICHSTEAALPDDKTKSNQITNKRKEFLEVPSWQRKFTIKSFTEKNPARPAKRIIMESSSKVRQTKDNNDSKFCFPLMKEADSLQQQRLRTEHILNVNTSVNVRPDAEVPCQIEIQADASDTGGTCSSVHQERPIRRWASDVTPQAQDRSITRTDAEKVENLSAEKESIPGVRRSKSDVDGERRATTLTVRHLVMASSFVLGDVGCDPKKERSASSNKRRKSRNQTTLVAVSVTAVFVLSFLPHLSLMIAKLLIFPGFDKDLTGVGFVIYNIFIRTYFINSASNPIIYGILNLHFRKQVKRVFRNLC